MQLEITDIQTMAKEKGKNVVANKASNNQQQRETTGNRQRREKVEEPKFSDNEQQGKDNKTYNFRSTSTRAKIETEKSEKEDNRNSE